MSSSTTKVCFNSNCKEESEKWNRGWRRRTGEYAHLCDRCASAFEEGKFCETFHLNASGWRCCESCGKQIHCGCIVSFHMFVLLDEGGIECLTCAKKSYILTPNPAWPPPLNFLPSQTGRVKDLPVRTWSALAGSGPVPWCQAASSFNGSNIQANVQLKMPFETDVSGGIDRYGICERLSTASPEIKPERSYERLVNGKLRLGLSETLQNGNTGFNVKEQRYPFTNDFKPVLPKRTSSSSNFNLGTASSSKLEIDDAPVSAVLSQPPAVPIPVGKHVCCQIGMDSSGETQIRNAMSRGDGGSRNQLPPCCHPKITDQELQLISRNSKSVITSLFEKMLSASDAGRVGRLVLPKKCAEAYFPQINHPEGLPLKVQDVKGKEWVFQFRFWPNNNSRMYVLEGITPCIQSMQLQAGDVVTFSRLEPEGTLVMGGRKASAIPSLYQGDEVALVGRDASTPGDGSARNKCRDVKFVNGHIKGKSSSRMWLISQEAKVDTGSTGSEIDKSGLITEGTLEDKPVIHGKRKNGNLGMKNKFLRIENGNMIELKLTWKEAQGLMRPPAKIVPSTVVVEGCEFEEFEEAEPIIGRPTVLGMNHFGEKIQWVQCEDCFKWRKVPADALFSSRWTCSDNVWDIHRSLCSSAEELTNEELEQMLLTMEKDSCNKGWSTEQDPDLFVALEGLDTLANLAIQGEGEGKELENLLAFSENRTKHPRHKPGCACIVCLRPPSGKGYKHRESCDCVVCSSLKRRFGTLMEGREKKQLEKEAGSSSQNLQWQPLHEKLWDETGNSSLNQEEIGNVVYLDEHNGRKPSTSPLKGQIDLNIQPEREEDLSSGSDSGPFKCSLLGSAEKLFRQQISLDSDVIGNLLGKQMQQDRGLNFISCVAIDGGHEKN